MPSTVGALQGTLELATGSADKLSLPVMASGLQPGPLVVQPAAGSYQDFGGVRVGVGDLNDDGLPDLIVGEGGKSQPVVRVFDVASLDILHHFAVFDAGFPGSVFVAGNS